jgi:cullin 1
MNNIIKNFDEAWNQIFNNGVIPLLNFLDNNDRNNDDKLFDKKTYIEIYTICYNISTQKSPYNFSNNLYQKYIDIIGDYLLNNVTNKLKNTNDDFILKEFIRHFNNLNIMVKWMRNFMIYLERYYIKSQHLDTFENISNKLFKNLILDKFKIKITNLLINAINNIRYYGLDNDYIVNVINIYEEMDMYNNYFINEFLESSREYYLITASKWLLEYNLLEYLNNIELLIKKEKQIISKYLHNDDEEKIIDILYNEILIKNFNKILSNEFFGFNYMLDNLLLDNLFQLYNLSNKFTEQLNYMSILFKDYMLKNSNFDSNIEELILINNKYNNIISRSFQNNNIFQKVKKDVFTSILNKDNNIELIITFIDKLFKSNDINLSDSCIDNIIKLYIYLTDKDLFIEQYRISLSKRLLNNNNTINNDLEKLIITKIKIESGLQLTSKIEGMINDLILSNEYNKLFTEYLIDNSINNNININILTNSHWPNFKLYDIIIPNEMKKITFIFNDYFIQKYNNRKISWIYTQGNILLTIILNKKVYDMNVTTLQAIVLLLFNNINNINNETLDFNTIFKLTNIPEEILKRILHSLSCGKIRILKKVDLNEKVIKNTDIFRLNKDFSNSLRKFKIPMPSFDDIKEKSNIVEENRIYLIDSLIVRIMKTRKTMNHHNLISEVLSQLINFKVEIKYIKQRIESLIEREFLERDENQKDFYNYLA